MGKVSRSHREKINAATDAQKHAYYGSVMPKLPFIKKDLKHALIVAPDQFASRSGCAMKAAADKLFAQEKINKDCDAARAAREVFKTAAQLFLYNEDRARLVMPIPMFDKYLKDLDELDGAKAEAISQAEEEEKREAMRMAKAAKRDWRNLLKLKLCLGMPLDDDTVTDEELAEIAMDAVVKAMRVGCAPLPEHRYARPLQRVAAKIHAICVVGGDVEPLPSAKSLYMLTHEEERQFSLEIITPLFAMHSSDARKKIAAEIVALAWPGAPMAPTNNAIVRQMEALAHIVSTSPVDEVFGIITSQYLPSILEVSSLQSKMSRSDRVSAADSLRTHMS